MHGPQKCKQILLVSDAYIDNFEQGAKLLINYPLDQNCLPSIGQKQKASTGKPRP